jgi:transcriptional regulator with XRE-family HTH domain
MLNTTVRVAKRPAPNRRRSLDRLSVKDTRHMPPRVVDVGGRLRALRNQHNLSLCGLADRSGLNVNTLSLIENGKTSPSVATLQQIAQALTVPIVAFFEVERPRQHWLYVKAGERANAVFAHGTLADLGAGMAERSIEPLVMTLEPNRGSGPQPIGHTGHEFVFCLQGRLLYTVEDQSYLLAKGDSLLFEAHLPHRRQNVDLGTTQALLVLCPADAPDEPTALHFGPPAGPTHPMEKEQ